MRRQVKEASDEQEADAAMVQEDNLTAGAGDTPADTEAEPVRVAAAVEGPDHGT